jgi:hypothetical protein
MSVKPDFTRLTTEELRAYVLEHQDDQEALYTYLDRRRSENPGSRFYTAEDEISEVISEYLKSKNQRPS